MPQHPAAAGLRPLSPSGRRRFRFPCGHVESERTLAGRVRSGDRVVWVGCAACNVIAMTATKAGRGRRGPVPATSV